MRKVIATAIAAVVLTGVLTSAPPLAAAGEPASRPATRPVPKITISAATTHILGPVKADGTIDYVAAFEARFGKGVTVANNAAILLLWALGPEYLPEEVRAGALKRLDMASLPAKGNYFVRFDDWLPEPGADEDVAEARREFAEAQRDRALTGPWLAKDLPQVAAWLKANEMPLAAAVAATQRSRYHVPGMYPTPAIFHRATPRLGTVHNLGRALAARAMLKLGRGQTRGARTDLLAAHRLARLIGQDPTLFARGLAYSVESRANEAEAALAASGRLTAAQGRAHLADLRALSPLASVRQAIDVGERWALLHCVMVCIRKGNAQELYPGFMPGEMPAEMRSLQGRQPDWDRVLRTINHWYTRSGDVAGIVNAAKRQAATEALRMDFHAYRRPTKYDISRSVWRGRAIREGGYTRRLTARLLVRPSMARMPSYANSREWSLQRGTLTQVALALAVHKAERGAYPASLAVLAPGILKAVPADRYSGKPLHYRREGGGYVLYSVGPDLDDDGGREAWKANEGSDIVVRVE